MVQWRRRWAAVHLVVGLLLVGCAGAPGPQEEEVGAQEPGGQEIGVRPPTDALVPEDAPPPAELQVEDLVVGEGAAAAEGDLLQVHYVGVRWSDGQVFDASWEREQPLEFELGAGRLIEGWERGVVGMQVGGRRVVTIPPELAYGERGAPPAIAPGETLVFVVDLLEIS